MKSRTLFFLFLLLISTPILSNPQRGYYYFKQISVKEGLPTSVNSIYDDNNGLIWIGTSYGTYRFDGERLKKYPLQNAAQIHSYINSVGGDNRGNVLVFAQPGVYYYNLEQDVFKPLVRNGEIIGAYTVFSENDKTIIPVADTLLYYKSLYEEPDCLPLQNPGETVAIIKIDTYNEQYYIVRTIRRQLVLIDKQTGEVCESPFSDLSGVIDFYIDSQNRFWITQYARGVACYTRDGELIEVFSSAVFGLSSDVILDIEERNGQIWLATDGGGINIIHPESKQLTVLSSEFDRNFPTNSVTCLQNSTNNMWIGMVREGVLGMKENFITTYIKSPKNDPAGLSEKCPLCLFEDEDGKIWMGTDGEGINCFDPDTEKFTHFPPTFSDKIVSICPFSETELLASNFTKGIYVFNKITGEKRPFPIMNEQVDNQIHQLGSPVNLYINSNNDIEFHGGYFYRYLRKTKQFERILPPKGNFGGSWVPIGEYESNPYFHNQTNIFYYHKQADIYVPVSTNEARHIFSAQIDSTGILWMATRSGLTTWNLRTDERSVIKLPDENDVVTSLVKDHSGIMWLGTTSALYAYSPEEKRFVIFNESDGVLPNDFLAKPVLVTRNNHVYMGGATGLVRVNKSLIQHYQAGNPKLDLLEVELNGMNVAVDRTKEVPYLEIGPQFTSLSVRCKLDGTDVFRRQIYRYQIKGLDNHFTQSSRPRLTIQALPPGKYQIKAQCAQTDGLWSPSFDLLHLKVLPPWWKRPWFIILCVGLVLMFGVYLLYQREKRIQQKMERIQQELKEKERKIYKEKVKALININHELRTPLTLLYTPLKQLMNNTQIPYEIRKKLQGAFKQARQMKNIINMILNMRKMEVGQNTLQLTPTLFNNWLQTIVDDFKSEFEMRNIRLTFLPDPEICMVSLDTAQCEIIVNNLLMNAYKFSYPDSEVTVTTQLIPEQEFVRIEVKDEGIGLNSEDIENLFTRFQQGKHHIHGSGIGLNYAKQLVEIHGGSIGAMNNTPRGAVFYFTLPYQQVQTSVTCPPKPYLNELQPAVMLPTESTGPSADKFRSAIVVEDDPDLCSYLAENLQPLFETVYTAHDGMEAIPVIVSHFPQLVLSDIVMPRMNGFELCKRIKRNPDLSHTPVILLTSQIDEPNIKKSYKTGADAYIPKPFDMDLLVIQIQNLLHNRNIVRKRYAGTKDTDFPETGGDKKFLDEEFEIQLNNIIDERLDDTKLDVSMVAKLMHISRASLYSKMKNHIGMGIGSYITRKRISHAGNLLVHTDLSIREISEQTGFMHQRNFSTVFRKFMGESPVEYRKKRKNNEQLPDPS